ncbi:hypothetical protein CK623_06705 [Vandammella animalimorsus]|uniref:Zf-HC2 domain-containing protein n=1 Tax=Vandammella animalimorsus TaxID=2029117 RepID=A0A2A2ANL6_9BURK|nr:hypothetical protein [Vandammella animalimorsus]PAT35631.1 hypothetical protein CK625_12350 [Vandammella animalimorsus]PAT40185.1 hypothetical protein CK623_06705 [Vandammella animalimorsus]
MKCAQYIFKLTSGQLGADAPVSERAQAALHRLVCRHCREFARNDAALEDILGAYRQALQAPDLPDLPDSPERPGPAQPPQK